jgi:hypothetical protein
MAQGGPCAFLVARAVEQVEDGMAGARVLVVAGVGCRRTGRASCPPTSTCRCASGPYRAARHSRQEKRGMGQPELHREALARGRVAGASRRVLMLRCSRWAEVVPPSSALRAPSPRRGEGDGPATLPRGEAGAVVRTGRPHPTGSDFFGAIDWSTPSSSLALFGHVRDCESRRLWRFA